MMSRRDTLLVLQALSTRAELRRNRGMLLQRGQSTARSAESGIPYLGLLYILVVSQMVLVDLIIQILLQLNGSLSKRVSKLAV